MTERDLVNRCLNGDEEAWRELISRYRGYIYAIINKYERDPNNQDDLYGDILLKLVQQLRSWKGDSSFATWLYRVVQRICIDGVRREVNKPVTEGNVEEREDIAEDSTVEKKITNEELKALLAGIIAFELKEVEQLVITLIFYEELKQKEIADLLEKEEYEITRIKNSILGKLKKSCKKRGIDSSNL
jgi:RNA polymerase sigma factor (sigma-70 family)